MTLEEFFARNWYLTVESGNEAVRNYTGTSIAKRSNRHFRARKECLLKWAMKEFPNVDSEEIELLIDDTFPAPLISYQ